jgi:eukaryotic-like serine/threonine-protein kinase
MPAPTTISEYLDCVRRSCVVEDDRLSTYMEQLQAAGPLPVELSRLASQMVRDGILTNFQSEQFLQGKWKRFHIGKYKVLERLGSGGMGQVFLCEHKLMRRRVAIKVLPTTKAEDPVAKERFYREARAVAALDHPNVVRAFDVDQDGALHFLVLEHVDGSSLQDIVKKHGPMDPLRACHYIHQAAVGLDYAHQVAGIIHRDIKPGNIVVDRTGVVKILDMGLAKFFRDDDAALTNKFDDNVLGTADYLAPEQALDSSAVDIRADIYSLGATFYYMLAGNPPFPAGSAAQKLVWHQMKEPTSLKELRPELSNDIVTIVERMLKKIPDQRYSLPSEVAVALSPLTSIPIPPPPDHEMPQHSLAALAGVAPVGVNPRATAARQPGSPRGSSAISVASSSAIIPRPASGHFPVSPPPSLPRTPAPANEPNHEPPPPDNPFSLLLSGKGSNQPNKSSSALLETVYSTGSRIEAFDNAEPRKGRARTSWAYGLFGILAGAIMVASWWMQRPAPTANASPPQKTMQFTGRTWTVDPDGGGEFQRVMDAVRRAQPGDRIVIKSAAIQESLQIENHAGDHGDILIESGRADGRPILWTPPQNVAPTSHIIDIAGVNGVRLHNIVFDGQGRIGTPIRVTGVASGVTLERVHCRGFTKSGVYISDSHSDIDRPLRISASRFQSAYNGAVGVRISGSHPERPVNGIRIKDCSFEGSLEAAVFGDGPAIDLSFEDCRVFRATDGLSWKRFASDHVLRVVIAGNTFVELRNAAVHFESAPSNFDESTITFERSLGLRSGTMLQVDDGKPWFVKSLNNWRDAATKNGDLTPPAQQESVTVSTDATARDFLRYSRGHRLATAADGAPVGSPPLD